jgi:GH15 family glucan-1,4-alpha-glucosidase
VGDYPPIADHALIGDLQTAALVSVGGEIDWFCCPRFDSPSVFASLLDRERGGRFRIAPEGDAPVTRQLYLPETAVLFTRFLSPDGVGEVVDFMPVPDPEVPTANHRVVRVVRVVRGQMRFVFECAPRFDYGRVEHDLELTEGGAVFRGGRLALTLHSGIHLRREGDDVRADVTLHSGQARCMILESQADTAPRAVSAEEALRLLFSTRRFWRRWLAGSTYQGRWREQVARSALTLKLLTYAPTGGLVAAPSAGLPEQLGGERNWDYRYTWIRDAAFSVQALLKLGFHYEAQRFASWLGDRVREGVAGDGRPLQVMYRIDGSGDLAESTLEHWEGYAGSWPVRIGNGAARQLQLDIYGEAVNCLYHAEKSGGVLSNRDWAGLTAVLDWVCDNWNQPDEGIWETRGGREDFTYGRLMCWCALDRAVRL